MNKYFHNDVNDENLDIADQLLRESEKIEIPKHKSFEEILNSSDVKVNKEIKATKSVNPTWKKFNKFAALAACFVIVFIVGGVYFETQKPDEISVSKTKPTLQSDKTITDSSLHTASSYEEVHNAISKTFSYINNGSMDDLGFEESVDGIPKKYSALKDNSVDAAPTVNEDSTDYSTTNVQTENVDENDIVKTNGKYIFTLKSSYDSKNIVYISQVNGTSTKTVSKISKDSESNLSDEYFQGIYLYENYLMVISKKYIYSETDDDGVEDSYKDSISCYGYRNSKVMVIVYTYDISDVTKPKLVSTNTQEGNYVSSRLHNQYLYIITDKSVTKEDFLRDRKYVPEINGKCLTCDCIYIPETVDTPGFTIATVLDVTDSSSFKTSLSVVGNSDQIYMSQDNLYIINNYRDCIDLKDSENPFKDKKIKKGEYFNETVEYLREDFEWLYPDIDIDDVKEESYRRDVEYLPMVNIVKYHYDNENLTFVAEAKIEGEAYDNLFFDEKDDYLRFVCSTQVEKCTGFQFNFYDKENNLLLSSYDEMDYKSNKKTSSVVVLDEKLNMVATIDGLAKDESLYAARYLGDYGYFVTYEETDPLFSVDFSDINNPKITSKLKIPGYSTHLSFYGSDLLFGFGSEDIKNDSILKMEMYDISNGNATQKSKKYIGKDSYSPALHNYKALLIDPQKNLIGFNYEEYFQDGPEHNWRFHCDYRYALYEYRDNDFHSIFDIELKHDAEDVRGIYIDHYFYIINCEGGIYSIDLDTYAKTKKVVYDKF